MLTISKSILTSAEKMDLNGRSIYLLKDQKFADSISEKLVCAIIPFNGNGLIVISPKRMSKFSLDAQRFMLWHEIGHLMLGHTDRPGKRDLTQELEADWYAANRTSRKCGRQALSESVAVFGADKNGSEFAARIAALG